MKDQYGKIKNKSKNKKYICLDDDEYSDSSVQKKKKGQLLTERRVLPCETVRRASPLVA